MDSMMITIIGSAHVFDISERIEKEIRARSPPVVAVELDRNRYEGLRRRDSGDRKGVPLVYRLLHLVQKRIAKKFGVQIGEEMLAAVDTAKSINSRVAFIDLPAQKVLNQLMNEMSLKEKLKLFAGGIIGLFTSKERIEKEVENYNSGGSGMGFTVSLEEQMPALTKILIEDRNRFMAKNLKELEDRFDSVVAVVGDGHVPGLKKELRGRELEILRLKDVMNGEKEQSEMESGERNEGNAEVNFSVEYKAD
ncbi:MAG: TraB/GumN family protein [Candidatus Thermoplasmatota archaeon]